MKNISDKKPLWKKILFAFLAILGVLVLGVCILLGVLSATEYRPADSESVAVSGDAAKTLSVGESLSVLTWNIGYGALGDNADFFMDGGSHVKTATKERVIENLTDIARTVASLDPDIIFFQEADNDSKRSHHVDEAAMLTDAFDGYESAFAANYKCLYVPYPIPTIGAVDSGILTLSRYAVESATRVSLPCPFSWPVRLANLKRGLLVERIPLENSEKELVVVNLHLEAYDNGEGKIAQTKELKELLESEVEAGNYVIAGGDFNQSFSNIDTDAYEVTDENLWAPGEIDADAFSDGLTCIADNTTPSCRSLDQPYEGADPDNFQYYLIDGYIVSSNIEVLSLETLDEGFVSTDHNPVLLSVTLSAE